MKISTIVFPTKGSTIFLAEKKRGFGRGHLNGYGGKKEPGDATIENAAARELWEEAGIAAVPEDLERVAVIRFFQKVQRWWPGLLLFGSYRAGFECHIFFCKNWRGDFRETEEMALPQEFAISHLPFERMWHSDQTWLPLVCSGKKINAKSFYDEKMERQERFEYVPL